MNRRLAVLAVTAALIAGACGDDADGEAAPTPTSTTAASTTTTVAESTTTTTSTTTTEAPAPEVVSATRVFVDESRVTPASGEQAESPERTLDVWVDALSGDDQRPLVIVAHGLTGHPRFHEMLRVHLAEAGFVVAAPVFPLTNRDSGLADASDIAGQVGDVSFVIDSMLEDPEFGPLIDPGRIGVIGHSLGGLTTAGVALSAEGDGRISAAMVMSAGFGQVRPGIAVLVLHGDADGLVPIASSTASYAIAEERRMFVTLLGGDHNTGIGDDDSDYGPVVRGFAAAFFAHELGHDPSGAVDALLAADVSLASVEAGTADGPLDDWTGYFTG